MTDGAVTGLEPRTAARAAGARRPVQRRAPEVGLVAIVAIGMLGSTLGVTLGGVRLSPFRLAGVGAATWALVVGRTELRRLGRRTTVLLGIATAWLAWGVASVAWAPAADAALVDLLALVGGVGTVVSVAWLCERAGGIHALLVGWWVAATLASLLALGELVTGIHPPSDFLALRPGFNDRFFTSTFGNPNDFAAFVLVAIPSALALLSTSTSARVRAALATSISLMALMIVASQSRLCSVGLVFVAAVEVRARVRPLRRALPWLMAGAIGLGLIVAASPPIREKFARIPSEVSAGGSIGDRLVLSTEGLRQAGHTGFVGLGAGGFAPTIRALPEQLARSGDVNPHNFPIEVFAQYGALVFAAVAGWWVWALRTTTQLARAARARRARRSLLLAIAARSTLVALLLASLDPSSFIPSPTCWLGVATAAVLLRQATVDADLASR
ncbi:MAG: O-antigen ligase family protein [Acidimicrobiales bacterium]